MPPPIGPEHGVSVVIRMMRAGAAAAAVLVLPAVLQAQQRTVDVRVPGSVRAPSAATGSATRAEARAWYDELQRIGGRLQAVHARALEDAQLREAQESLFAEIKERMERVDPGLAGLVDRAQAIEAEARRAREAGDRTRLRALATEASQIQGRFLAARGRVMAQPEIAARIRAHEAQLHRRMLQVEPELDQLLARSRELQARLVRAVRGQQGARQ